MAFVFIVQRGRPYVNSFLVPIGDRVSIIEYNLPSKHTRFKLSDFIDHRWQWKPLWEDNLSTISPTRDFNVDLVAHYRRCYSYNCIRPGADSYIQLVWKFEESAMI